MSGTTQYTFTDAQLVDIRRFCGYPAQGDALTGMSSFHFFQSYGYLNYRIANLTYDEAQVVINTWLVNLNTLEQNLINVGITGAIDTESAAVWHRNMDEIRDRKMLYNQTRLDLCAFLDVPPGPGLTRSSGMTCRLIA